MYVLYMYILVLSVKRTKFFFFIKLLYIFFTLLLDSVTLSEILFAPSVNDCSKRECYCEIEPYSIWLFLLMLYNVIYCFQ